MLSVPHLDREFDYLVTAEQSDDAQPGVRVRVRFHGRLVDAFVLERRSDTDHVGRLARLERVVSPEVVLTPQIRRLVDAVAARYAGTRADVLRLAVPPRHARAERDAAAPPALPVVVAPQPDGWAPYSRGGQFLAALAESRAALAAPRAARCGLRRPGGPPPPLPAPGAAAAPAAAAPRGRPVAGAARRGGAAPRSRGAQSPRGRAARRAGRAAGRPRLGECWTHR